MLMFNVYAPCFVEKEMFNSYKYLTEEDKELLSRCALLHLDDVPAPEGMKVICAWYLHRSPLSKNDIVISRDRIAATEEDLKRLIDPDDDYLLADSLLKEGVVQQLREGKGMKLSPVDVTVYTVMFLDEETQEWLIQPDGFEVGEITGDIWLHTNATVDEDVANVYIDKYMDKLQERWTADPEKNLWTWKELHEEFWKKVHLL